MNALPVPAQLTRRTLFKAAALTALTPRIDHSMVEAQGDSVDYPTAFAGVVTETLSDVTISATLLPNDSYGVGFYLSEIPAQSSATFDHPNDAVQIAMVLAGGPVEELVVAGDWKASPRAVITPLIPGTIDNSRAGDTKVAVDFSTPVTTTNPTNDWARALVVEIEDPTLPPDREVARTGERSQATWLGYMSQSDWTDYGLSGKSVRVTMRRTTIDAGITISRAEPNPILRYLVSGNLEMVISFGKELPSKSIHIDPASTVPFVPLVGEGTLGLMNNGSDPAVLWELELMPIN